MSPLALVTTRRALGACAAITWLLVPGALAGGCSGGGGDTFIIQGGTTAPVSTSLERKDDMPGVVVEVLSVAGSRGPGANLDVGDTVATTFRVRRRDGTALPLSELDRAEVLLSGPTFNYQPVLLAQGDVKTRATANGDGSYTYVFAAPIPATYPAPANDTSAFGKLDGELQGQALLSGTYTLGLMASKDYSIEGVVHPDAGSATKDVLFGASTALAPREAVSDAACARCHDEVRHHDDRRVGVRLCVLCHTAGAEDGNDPAVLNGTPRVTIDLRSLVHKIHDGLYLPSVNGVETASDGSRQYPTSGTPFRTVDSKGKIKDYSAVTIPTPQHLNSGLALPRDLGYTALASLPQTTPSQQTRDTAVRRGVVACALCHGDPDGAGPLAAPAQGSLASFQPSRAACGSCHDDVDFTRPYKANGQTMDPQPDDSSCVRCHGPASTEGDPNLLRVDAAHLHPLRNPNLAHGIRFTLQQVREAGTNDNDGILDPGEKVQLTFTVATVDSNAAVAPEAVNVIISGPTAYMNGTEVQRNRQLFLIGQSIPVAALGAQPYTVNVPDVVTLERLGVAAVGSTDVFTARQTPLYDQFGVATALRARTAALPAAGASTGNTTTTVASVTSTWGNTLDVVDGAGFARNDYVVIDDGLATEEYAQFGNLIVNPTTNVKTISFLTPLRFNHLAGAKVQEVTTTAVATNTYTIDSASGTISEAGAGFTTGRTILASYTTDFVVPSVYPQVRNNSQEVDESWGDWVGKPLLPGLYTVGVYGNRGLVVSAFGETQTYREASELSKLDVDFVAKVTGLKQPPAAIPDGGPTCLRCHDALAFHGATRAGFNGCIECHAATVEDNAQYRSATAAATPFVVVSFRQFIHALHNEGDFPAKGGTTRCEKCHGDGSTAWYQPRARDYPGSVTPNRVWRTVCTGCHETTQAKAHIDAQAGGGVVGSATYESCLVCHGPGRIMDVTVVHKPR